MAGRGDANGVVAVQNAGPVVGAGSLPNSFVYSPLWFTGVGLHGRAAVRGATRWSPATGCRPRPASAAPEQAAGQAAVVSGATARGGTAVLFGTEPLFRAHPKGLYAQFARALYLDRRLDRPRECRGPPPVGTPRTEITAE